MKKVIQVVLCLFLLYGVCYTQDAFANTLVDNNIGTVTQTLEQSVQPLDSNQLLTQNNIEAEILSELDSSDNLNMVALNEEEMDKIEGGWWWRIFQTFVIANPAVWTLRFFSLFATPVY